jgi:hypothetical protein
MSTKIWLTSEDNYTQHESREEANDAARRQAFKRQRDVYIFEYSKVAVAKFPLPDIQVVEFEDTQSPTPAAT